MSIYDREANGRGRYDESVFVGGTKISAGHDTNTLLTLPKQPNK